MDIEFVRLPLRNPKGLAIFLLITVVVLVYAPVKDYPFINYDDTLYVTEVPQVQQGLGWDSVVWSMTAMEAANWHPLTWLSHMLDVQLFGLNPAGHHLTNLLLHLANVLLLFGVLQQMTGAVWRSALVAALFALHPLNVESVAWVAERKNVLSTLFWLLTMAAYMGYVRKPHWGRYLGMMGIFVLGLMAKPMLVTLPCVLLLLDYWPLGRLGKDSKEFWERLPRLAAEKLPLFIPVAAISVVTIAAQSQAGALSSWEGLPLGIRVANAVLTYGVGLKKMLWPMDLAVFYPHPGNSLAVWPVALAALLLVILSLGVWWQGRRSRYLVVGWLWYLGTLFPVSGLIQVGGQAMADRYAYVPLMGLFIILAWGTAELAQTLRLPKAWLPAAGLCVVIVLIGAARLQLSHWRNSFTLFQHALESTQDNHMAHSNLGIAFLDNNDLDQAIGHFYKALEIKPTHAGVHTNLSIALRRKGMLDKALEHSIRSVQTNPDLAEAHNNLGISLFQKGRIEEALQEFRIALELKPDYTTCYYNLGVVLENQNRIEEAAESFRQALRLDPAHSQAQQHLTLLLEETSP
ncbi:MAG: tetratricopeptide repeat protein [Acidobacteria bacterium]|nr:tetratricopeptide repeat protein [Acidobacteriota bacterium]